MDARQPVAPAVTADRTGLLKLLRGAARRPPACLRRVRRIRRASRDGYRDRDAVRQRERHRRRRAIRRGQRYRIRRAIRHGRRPRRAIRRRRRYQIRRAIRYRDGIRRRNGIRERKAYAYAGPGFGRQRGGERQSRVRLRRDTRANCLRYVPLRPVQGPRQRVGRFRGARPLRIGVDAESPAALRPLHLRRERRLRPRRLFRDVLRLRESAIPPF